MDGKPPQTEKERRLAALAARMATPVERIDNSRLPAGSPMAYYCQICGDLAAILPESHICPAPRLCGECAFLKEMGWLE